MDLRGGGVVGTFLQAPTADRLDMLVDVLIEVDAQGVIVDMLPSDHPDRQAAEARLGGRLLRLPQEHFGLPGLVDLHVHAPQYPQLGLALDEPLEVWLGKYTFPLEARYADLGYARPRFEKLVDDLLAGGTTTALYFAVQDREASKLLADICITKGQRALVGKVAMDHPQNCPPDYRDASAAAAVADTRAVIEHIRGHADNGDGRVLPVVTPRFVPACSDAALKGLGALAAECGCHVQTHCSESDWAHAHALERYGRTDAAALDGFGLLTRKSVLAHSNFLTTGDMDLLVGRGSGVAHCALSNAYFANAVFPLAAALERGVHVGLGTDISGGPSASMFEACRMSVAASRMLETGTDPDLPAEERGRPGSAVDMVTAFHLATAGGGVALDLPIGVLAPGYRMDLVVIDCAAPLGEIALFEARTPAEILAKIIYGAVRANVAMTLVDGVVVGGTLMGAPAQ